MSFEETSRGAERGAQENTERILADIQLRMGSDAFLEMMRKVDKNEPLSEEETEIIKTLKQDPNLGK